MSRLEVLLSHQPAPATLGVNALLSFDGGERARIHLSNGAQSRLTFIQMAARRLLATGISQAQLVGEGWDLEAQWAFHQGYSSARRSDSLTYAPLAPADQFEFDARRLAVGKVREWINLPPAELTPRLLADYALDYLRSFDVPMQIERIEGDALAERGYAGIHAVGRASVEPPVYLRVDVNPTGDAAAKTEVALVGKGITFDSGGYSIKTNEGMLTMKCDMGGAATCVGALGLALARGLKRRVSLHLCCAENLIAGNAYKLGDVIRYRNGVSVEIVNTDAEGRLVLADGLIDAAATGAPLIIDAATLTGAAITALGNHYHAVFAPDDATREQYLRLAALELEPHWPLPVASFHLGLTPSPYADTANSRPIKGGGPGGASVAAGFLWRFVPGGRRWVHLDLAASFNGNDTALYAAGASGIGVRTMARALLEL